MKEVWMQRLSEAGFEFHNSFLRAHCGGWLLVECVLMRACVRACAWRPCFHLYGADRVFFCPSVTLRSKWKTQGWIGPFWVFEISCPASMETHTHLHTLTDRSRACNHTVHLPTLAHTPVSHLVGVWSSIMLSHPLCLSRRLFWGTEPSTRSVHDDICLSCAHSPGCAKRTLITPA